MDYAIVPTPIGRLLLVADAGALLRIDFDGSWSYARIGADWREGSPLLERAAAQLREYFAGHRREFELPLAPKGTEFQRRVWNELTRIPHGTAISYATLAQRIGSPAAMRAVGAANGRNPIPVVVPCHRVVGADGSLTGFGGGLPLKRWLLAHEGADLSALGGSRQSALPFA